MKRNKRHLVYSLLMAGLICALLAGLQACTDPVKVGDKFLAKPPSVDVNKDSIFSKAQWAKRFLWGAYNELPTGWFYRDNNIKYLGRSPLAALTDIDQEYTGCGGCGAGGYYKGSYNASGAGGNFTAYPYNSRGGLQWKAVRRAHIFINNVGRVPGMDAAAKQQLKAEARMIIAVTYTRMFRHLGGVPWVYKVYAPDDDFNLPRLTARATLDSIVTTIDEAIPHLPFVLKQPSTELGRLTQAGAMGLKCRVLLFGASPLFNSPQPYMQGEAADKKLVWYGGKDPSLWQDAADACGALVKKVQQTGAYHLVDTGHPRQDFRKGYLDRESPEILISTRRKRSGGDSYNPDRFLKNALLGGGSFGTTDNYVQLFPMANGTQIDAPGSGYDPAHPYKNRDPRLYESVLVNGDQFQNRTAELWIGGRERKNISKPTVWTGYRARKFFLDLQSNKGLPFQWPLLRLSDVYLSYAEALNEVNEGPTAEAYTYINKVRNRVALDDLPRGKTQKQFRRAVLRERGRELGYEENRWFDMIRWKRKDIFKKKLFGMDICKKGVSPPNLCTDKGYGYHESSKYIYSRFKLPDRYWQNNFSPKWYLSAYPQSEINKRYGLIQNPGW